MKKNQHLKLSKLGIATVFLVISAVFYVACSIIVDSISVSLSVQKQNINKQINTLEIQNKELSIEVNTMSEYTNVSARIESEGMTNTHIINLGN